VYSIAITGARGYIGRHLVARLVAKGVRPRCLIRPASDLAGLPAVRIEVVRGDVTDARSLPALLEGVDFVVHAASIVANIKQTRRDTYRQTNEQGTANLVVEARAMGVRRLIYMGGMNTVPAAAGSYMRTRFEAEQQVRQGRVPYAILQPSILFGSGSAFFAALAGLVRLAPVVPVPGNGRMRFQPIWVEDVVSCIEGLLVAGHDDETVPVGGPAAYTYDQLLDLVIKALGKRRLKLHMPLALMRAGALAMQVVLPRPPVTAATLELFALGADNVTRLDAVAWRFGIEPQPLDAYLQAHGL
jgi:NADH dehydrogenase